MDFSAKLRTCLWFDQNGHEAATFYVSLLPDSRIETTVQPDPAEPPLVVEFRLSGAPYMILNGGPMFRHSEAASISVLTEDQPETDRLWAALTADGGAPGQCGWLKDRFGVSWQVVPTSFVEMMKAGEANGPGYERAFKAMLEMKKLDVGELQKAYRG